MKRNKDNRSYIERPELGGRTPTAQFGWQQIRKSADAVEYQKKDGEWSQELTEVPPTNRRAVFTPETAEVERDTLAAWNSLQGKREESPVQTEKSYERLRNARRTQKPATLFVPWGVRPKGKIGPELEVLDEIERVQKDLRQRNIPSEVIIMPADTYATEVNGLDQRQTDAYFKNIQQEAEQRGMKVKPWSRIRSENADRYREITERIDDRQLRNVVGKDGSMERVRSAAWNKSETGDPETAAKAYLRERIAEAKIVEETMQPIKVSVARREKDNGVDGPLPRVYVIPKRLRLPWLK